MQLQDGRAATQGNNEALKDGTVTRAGSRFDFEEVPVLVQAFRRMVRDLEFDVCEMAFTTYLVRQGARRAVHRDPGLPGARLPPRRHRPRHRGRHRDAQGPRGQRVGVNRGYTVTTGVWARGDPAGRARRRPGPGDLGALRRRARRGVLPAGRTSCRSRGRRPRRAGGVRRDRRGDRAAGRRPRGRPDARPADPGPGRGRRSPPCRRAATTRSTTWS